MFSLDQNSTWVFRLTSGFYFLALRGLRNQNFPRSFQLSNFGRNILVFRRFSPLVYELGLIKTVS